MAKPTKLKALQGTLNVTRVNKEEPMPKSNNVPKLPKGMTGEAKNCWLETAKELDAIGLLTNVDVAVLTLHCYAWATWKEAQAQIKLEGSVITAPSGYPVQSPWVSISNKAFDQLMKTAASFGMTPVARQKVAASKESETDVVGEFLKQRKTGK